jgi:PLP dependent protein
MASLIGQITATRVKDNLERVQEQVALAAVGSGRDPAHIQVLAATKYVRAQDLPTLAEAGIKLVGENRAQDLQAKIAAHGELFTWDFIGQLQSRKVRQVIPHVRLIHSVSSQSVLTELERHRAHARPGLGVLIQVNLTGEHSKAGVTVDQLDAFIDRCAVAVRGLMTMPPLSPCAEDSRRWFAALARLARERELAELSMGTSQDYSVAVQEGATIVRIGTSLYA